MNGTEKKIKHYDLSGLKFIFYSQIASLILSMAGAGVQKHLLISVVVSILALAAAAVSVAGVFKIGRYGKHFKKCRRIILAMFIMSFAIVLLFLILINRHQQDLMSVTALFLPVVVGIAAGILGILFIYHLFYGCGEIGEREADESFAGRCRRGWKLYIICLILAVVSLLTAWICAFTLKDSMVVAAVFIIIAGVCAMAMLVKILQIIYVTFKKYDGKPIGTAANPSKTQILSDLDNTRELVLDDKGDQ